MSNQRHMRSNVACLLPLSAGSSLFKLPRLFHRRLNRVLVISALWFCIGYAFGVRADSIGLNFIGGSFLGGVPQPLAGTETAGFVPQRFWNNAAGNSGSTSLQGDAGAGFAAYYSGCLATWAAGIETWTTGIADTGGNTRLMKGYLQSYGSANGSNFVSVAGLPVQLTTQGYAVIAYFDTDNANAFGGADKVCKFTLNTKSFGTRTVFGRDAANVDFAGTFKQVATSSSADLGSATPAGNIVIFTGLTDDSFTLTVSGSSASDGSPDGALNGIQIVPQSALPASLVPPVITSPSSAGATVLVPFTYLISADNSPTGFGAFGLPAGLALNPYSGLISGTPNVPGTYSVTLSATNSAGSGTAILNLSVATGFSGNGVTSGTTNDLTGGSLVGITTGWIVGGNGTLLFTTNSGQSWEPIVLGFTNSLTCVRGVGSSVFLSGAWGLLAVSPDFGLDWTICPLGLTNTFFSMDFLSPFYGYAVGSGGLICFWNGSQWIPEGTGTTQDLYSVCVIGSSAYAAGGGGVICRLVGTNWIVLDSGAAPNVEFYDVAFYNENFGYAVGSNGAIYQTTNGGTNWLALNSGTYVTLRGIRVVDPNTAWAVGDGGVLLLTTDGGAHWTLLSMGTSLDLSGIDFVNGRGLIYGGYGFVYIFQQTGYPFNYSPWVKLTAPSTNQTVCVCSKLSFQATAFDPDGYIARIELFLDATKLAESTTSVLHYDWPNEALLGTYTCVAKATDNLGATAFSSPVTLTMVMPAGEQLRALTLWPTNAFEFCLIGQTGNVYSIQVSTNLPAWTPWQTVTNRTGVLPLIDAEAPLPPSKFYRALHQ